MALLLMDGFDAGDMAVKGWSNPSQSSSGTSPATRFGVGRWGGVSNGVCVKAIAPSTEIYAGFAIANLYYDGNLRSFVSIYTDAQTSQQISVGLTNAQVVVKRGNQFGTILAAYTMPIAKNGFYYLEINVVISATVGKVIVKYNGATIINFSGNTKNGGVSDTIDGFGLGCDGGTTAAFDDLYVCDTTGGAPYNNFLGDVRVHTITPNSAGSSTQFVPSSGANYTTVDELPYSASDYVTGAIGQKDLYGISDIPVTSGPVLAVQANVIAKKTDAGTINVRNVIKSGSTTVNGASVSMIPSDVTVSTAWTVNPVTSSSWTISDVNNLELGAETL